MAEYIEREALLAEIDRSFEESPIENTNAWMVVRRIVRKFPAADVEPVRHGHWIYIGTNKTDNIFTCSECGRRIKNPCYETTVIVKIRFPYCNCGAKMDGKEEEG